jgi:hypothetical protein
MGFLRWLQRKGSTGSVARWAYKGYTTLKAQDSSLSEADICEALFSMRYTTLPPRGKELRRYDTLVSEGSDISDLRQLCMAIAEIEFGISVIEDRRLWRNVLEVIEEELQRLGYGRPGTE